MQMRRTFGISLACLVTSACAISKTPEDGPSYYADEAAKVPDPCCRLVPGAVVETVAQLGVAVDEHSLPRDQHVVEDHHRVGLVKARRQRVIHRRSGVLVDHRGAADEAQTRRVDLDTEPEGVGLGLLAGGEVGRRQDDESCA